MKSGKHGKQIRAASATVGVVAAALCLGGTLPASAETESVQNHSMGDSIRAEQGKAPKAFSAIDKRAARLADTVRGVDVASHQGNVDWAGQWNAGKRFTWVKATEGTGYTNPYFGQQYNGSYDKGFIRGAYHFAHPDSTSGAEQANYFIAHGGGWTGDGKTLPGALDMESVQGKPACYGLSKSAMGAWIKDFSDTYHAKTKKYPAIYTSANWWSQCVDGDFAKTNPLWVARYAADPGQLPGTWGGYSVWQYSDSPIDQNVFNGSMDQLTKFATAAD
ncbi:lysozyme [Sciscionella sediminilitoris]|uniref:lysozyme n=1 Tax=Sciscionella sediminilitoris TaxID=1445613 RepID=UPI0004DFA7DC|nr:lysozyme [Sciscionella sp. SE31]